MKSTHLLGTMALILSFCYAGQAQTQSRQDGGDEILAVINGKLIITQKEIDGLIGSQIYELLERIYNLRKNALNNLVTRMLLEEEARARGITVEELKSRLVPDQVEVKASRVEQFYAENAGSFGTMSEDEARQRIKLDMEAQQKLERYRAAIAEIRNKAQIEMFLSVPLQPVVSVSGEGPSTGSKDAPVTIVEFSDFQCPYCKQAAGTLKQVLESYGPGVRLVFKHLPLPIHPQAFKAAQAAVCASEQGKFWEYHDRLFTAKDLSADSLAAIAEATGLRKADFDSCIGSEASRAAVLKDMQEARRLDLHGTPTFFINGRPLRGAKNLDDFKNAINQEMQASRKDSKAGPSSK